MWSMIYIYMNMFRDLFLSLFKLFLKIVLTMKAFEIHETLHKTIQNISTHGIPIMSSFILLRSMMQEVAGAR